MSNINLSIPHFKGNEWTYLKECIDTGWVSTAGKYVELFEKEICNYTGSKHAIACNCGTSALQMSLILSGIDHNSEVIVPTLTFIATVNAVSYLNAEPIFMDCDNFMNIDIDKVYDFCKNECTQTDDGLKNKKTNKIIKAIIPVHIFGNPCDMESLIKIAKEFHLKIVEDAAESIGSYFTAGKLEKRHTGTIGDIGVFSFNGNKIITSGGGGMILTNDSVIAERAKYLTSQAKDDAINFLHNDIGYNFRMTNIQAALGLAQFEQLEEFIEIKQRNYLQYKEHLAKIKGLTIIDIPDNTRPNYWFYSLLVNKKEFGLNRNQLLSELSKSKIQTRPVWILNHKQKPYLEKQAYKIEKAYQYQEEVLNLPCSTNLSEEDVEKVCDSISKIVR